ncbi:MAG: hypothetical protein ACK5NK_07615 [Niabella sp.]
MNKLLLLLYFMFSCFFSSGKDYFLKKDFEISDAEKLEVKWKGLPLIIGDENSWLKGKPLGDFSKNYTKQKIGSWDVLNIWNEGIPLPFRREVGVSADGKSAELNFQCHQEALMKSYPLPVISYKLFIPLSVLGDASWEAFVGRSQNAKWEFGRLDSETKDGHLITARWISFKTSHGNLTFDFNPQGVPTYFVAGMNTIHSQCVIAKSGDNLVFSFSTLASNSGGDMTVKFRIFEGSKDDYLNYHATDFYHYFSEMPKDKLFCFGERASQLFTNAGIEKYNTKKRYGWKSNTGLRKTGGESAGALYSCAASEISNSFRTSGLQSGLYLVTLKSSALECDIGPFSVALNGENIFDNVKIKKGNVATITVARWLESGSCELKFDGDWAVSVVGYQMFMHSQEDFEFRRGFWIKDDTYTPGILFSNYYSTKPFYGKSLQTTKLSGEIKEIDKIPALPVLKPSLPQNSLALNWRFNSQLGTMGPDNWGTFKEFNNCQKIDDRLQQIKEGGVNAVILNGLLSRHTYPTHLKRVEKNIRAIVEVGRKKNMKFIDHQDLTILWNADMGFRFLAEYPEFLQYTLSDGMPTWGICPSNKLFNEKYFFPFISKFIKTTGIDGMMIDEAAFHGNNFCGCGYCRTAFTKTTGLTLPDDETSPLLRNKKSLLWKTWIEWRKISIAQWRIEFANLTHKINPGFSNVQYYSESGFISEGASYEQGGDLALSAKSMDFLGTEIMSRDIWDDYRYTFSSRHMYNSLRETYGSPIFGLVYPAGKINNAIMGWAMNNMLGQVTWSLIDYTNFKIMDQYTGWKQNMNNINAKPFADIAILFSRKTRDWSPNNKTYQHEVMGLSQYFAEKHIQHTFILDDALLNQDLSRFRVLMAMGMDCLSDDQLLKLKKFVLAGGTVYITGDAGKYDSFGERRYEPAFSFIKKNRKASENNYIIKVNFGKGQFIYSEQKNILNEYSSSFTTGSKYVFNQDTRKTMENDTIIRSVIGRKLSFEPIQIPEKVLTSVYHEVRNGDNLLLVHFLNATGVTVKNSDILPLPNKMWKKIDTEIVFEITTPNISKAFYVSPDDEGQKSVKVEKISSSLYRVTLPVGTVDKYGIVYLNE